jgi:amino-acid N-acetyltransferase
LTKKAVEAEELVRRTRSEMEKNVSEYYIFEIDNNPVGCVALHVYPGQQKGELASLYVDPSYGHQGIGRKLMRFMEEKAREMGLTELIALSTQAFTYFELKGGFVEGTVDDLPPVRREKYMQSGRNSRVLIKKLHVLALGKRDALTL